MAEADPLASLKIWSVDITLGAGTFTIPALPAGVWLRSLYENFGSLGPLFDLLPDDERRRLEDQEFEGKTNEGEIIEAFMETLTVVAGRPWWQAITLLNIMRSDWSRLHGQVMLSGVDLEQISFAAYLDMAFAVLVKNADHTGVTKIKNSIETPPMGLPVKLNEDEEGQTFLSMLNQSR